MQTDSLGRLRIAVSVVLCPHEKVKWKEVVWLTSCSHRVQVRALGATKWRRITCAFVFTPLSMAAEFSTMDLIRQNLNLVRKKDVRAVDFLSVLGANCSLSC